MCKFLMISRVLYDKGYQQFVDAAKIISKECPEAKFILLGDIDESYPNHVPRDVVEKDAANGVIEYLGYRKDVKDIIKQCDCIVHPTYYNEGLSRVLMEALAMCKPIITTDIPGCQETVDDGVNGFLCIPQDTKSLIDAIKKFLRTSSAVRNEMGLAGRRKAEEEFDIKDVIKVYRSITQNISNGE